jgi:hypothetical protein
MKEKFRDTEDDWVGKKFEKRKNKNSKKLKRSKPRKSSGWN